MENGYIMSLCCLFVASSPIFMDWSINLLCKSNVIKIVFNEWRLILSTQSCSFSFIFQIFCMAKVTDLVICYHF